MAEANPSEVELTAAHEKVTLRVGADILTFLVDQRGVTNGAIVPPVFVLRWLGRTGVKWLRQLRLQDPRHANGRAKIRFLVSMVLIKSGKTHKNLAGRTGEN